jgi:deoxycytidylate deaminase
MKQKHRDFIALAESIAQSSSHSVFRHGAILVFRTNVIALGHNSFKFHAEKDCFKNLKVSRAKTGYYTLYTARVNNSCTPRLGKPCDQCVSFLQKHNVKTVYYTTNDGTIEKEHIL